MNPLISIIIPTYNCGHLIDRCIRSIQQQTYQNFEIIILDDKSPDQESIEVQKEWAKKESRINLILKEKNGGDSRTEGVAIAKGQYICFMDQDDWMPKDALEVMLEAIEKHDADVVVGQVGKAIKFCGIVKTFKQKPDPLAGRTFTHEELLEEPYESYFGHNVLPVSVWGKLYKKELFDRAEFPAVWPKAGCGDLILSMHLHESIKKLVVIPEMVYCYFVGMPGSGPKYLNGWLPRACTLFEYKWAFIEKHNIKRAIRYQAVEMINYIRTYVSLCTVYDRKNREARIKVLEETLENPIWQKVSLQTETYRDQHLRDMILQKKGREIYDYLEAQALNAPLRQRMMYPVKRMFARLKMFS